MIALGGLYPAKTVPSLRTIAMLFQDLLVESSGGIPVSGRLQALTKVQSCRNITGPLFQCRSKSFGGHLKLALLQLHEAEQASPVEVLRFQRKCTRVSLRRCNILIIRMENHT